MEENSKQQMQNQTLQQEQQGHMPSQQETPQQKPPQQGHVQPQQGYVQGQTYQQTKEEKTQRARIFQILAVPTLLYAAVATFLLFENWAGITMPIFVAGTAVYVGYVLKQAGKRKKKYIWWYVTVMLLLGVSDVLTGNTVIQAYNNTGIFLLLICMLLYQYGDVRRWRLGKYGAAVFAAVFGAIGAVFEPFSDGASYFSAGEKAKHSKGIYVLIGAGVSVPFLAVVVALLYSADAVFADFLKNGLRLEAGTLVRAGLLFVVIFFSAYCGMRYMERGKFLGESGPKKQWEPLIAITVTALVSVVYAIFSGIQILYLFWGKMELPAGYTYAAYAREGFFQLLFVCLLNLAMVLVIQELFAQHGLLKILLTFLCGCTYIMAASSAYRMLLYVRVYHLTFLRVLVLWALVVIAVLLAGVLLQIWKKDFPLLVYGFCVVCVCYLALSFGHVDYFIAKYNLAQMQKNTSGGTMEEAEIDFYYLLGLSTDAAPAIYEACYAKDGRPMEELLSKEDALRLSQELGWYKQRIEAETDDSPRQFNVSHAYARKLFENKDATEAAADGND